MNDITLHYGNCMDMMEALPEGCADLVVTSPPYNIGKEYELGQLSISQYQRWQLDVFREAMRICKRNGNICWQIGNCIERTGEVIPLDCFLFNAFRACGVFARNRIVWTFEHGLHCKNRFSGRHETILWFSRSCDEYIFNLDDVRVPQKYPNKKHYKGPKKGQVSSNPAGKNPGDVWNIPNVKHNHVEKTDHPCQFPVELVGRLICALSNPGGLVVDPFMGVGSTGVAAVLHGRRFAGADTMENYVIEAQNRINKAKEGTLRVRNRK